MADDTITLKPILPNEWLPDRCMNIGGPFDPYSHPVQSGCPSINFCKKHNRNALEQLYVSVIKEYGGCGFIAWENKKVVAYHNFFPAQTAQKIRFYGFGTDPTDTHATLVHNCITICRNYSRKGISSRLIRESINWATVNQWERFEVHHVLPDCKRDGKRTKRAVHHFGKNSVLTYSMNIKQIKKPNSFTGSKKGILCD